MHLYLFVRGKFEQVELWKSHVQTAYWKFKRIKKGKEGTILVQGALRPSVLGAYEYIFPKEALAEVCTFLGISTRGDGAYGFGKMGLETRQFALRKIFRCKKIPEKIIKQSQQIAPTFSTKEFERGCSNCVIPGVAIHVIGIKDDPVGEMGEYTQELL